MFGQVQTIFEMGHFCRYILFHPSQAKKTCIFCFLKHPAMPLSCTGTEIINMVLCKSNLNAIDRREEGAEESVWTRVQTMTRVLVNCL